MNAPSAVTARNPTMRAAILTGKDTSHHLASCARATPAGHPDPRVRSTEAAYGSRSCGRATSAARTSALNDEIVMMRQRRVLQRIAFESLRLTWAAGWSTSTDD